MAIQITNKKVVSFYHANPNISVDHVNLLLVDMMEKMVHDSVNTSIVSQLLERIKNVESEVVSTKESVTKLQPEMLMNFSMKLVEMKKEYMEDIRTILSTNVTEKIAPVMKEYINHLIDKTALLFQDIPKSQAALSIKLQDSIRDLQKDNDISEDIFFATLLRINKIKMYCDHDASQEIGHIGDHEYRWNNA